MRSISQFFVALCLLLGLSRLAYAQTANLRLDTQLNCATGQYTATIQIRADSPTSFSIGTSSVFLSYDPASLTFVSYQSLNFDETTVCAGQALWDPHNFDASTLGLFNLTINLNSTTVSCPLISNTDWVSIGQLTFTVLNQAGNPTLLFSADNTSFNALPGNNGLTQISAGLFTGVDQPGVLACPPPCSSACLPVVVTRIR
ncbi:hypothetical protein A6C57_16030 [Fibrella sp. ES10-3-2-2]|nr:hypothetical protein A6C57_16030 [Fibrella sp. ES10-3-2-2]